MKGDTLAKDHITVNFVKSVSIVTVVARLMKRFILRKSSTNVIIVINTLKEEQSVLCTKEHILVKSLLTAVNVEGVFLARARLEDMKDLI